jgi:hypothetical protein
MNGGFARSRPFITTSRGTTLPANDKRSTGRRGVTSTTPYRRYLCLCVAGLTSTTGSVSDDCRRQATGKNTRVMDSRVFITRCNQRAYVACVRVFIALQLAHRRPFTSYDLILTPTFRAGVHCPSRRFAEFHEAIASKLMEDGVHDALPADAERVTAFFDPTRVEVCKPTGNWATQKAVFSGDKWYHNSGALGTCGPDGVFYDWFDDPLGAHNDQEFMRESGLNSMMEEIDIQLGLNFTVYTDKGLTPDTHVTCAARGPLAPGQEQNNWRMARVRVTNEWGFAKVYERCPFIKRVQLLKLKKVNVAMLIRNAVLLTNMHTCIHGSNASLYSNVAAPSLASYMQ